MVSHYYPFIFNDLPEERERSEILAGRVREFSDFLANVMGVGDLGARIEGKAVFHCGCHQRRELGVLEEPRELLSHVEGLDLLDWRTRSCVAGSGGPSR